MAAVITRFYPEGDAFLAVRISRASPPPWAAWPGLRVRATEAAGAAGALRATRADNPGPARPPWDELTVPPPGKPPFKPLRSEGRRRTLSFPLFADHPFLRPYIRYSSVEEFMFVRRNYSKAA